jgi:hypothetical protein
MKLLMIVFTLALTACSSSSKGGGRYMWSESDSNSLAPGAAFAAEGFTFRKEMPDRREWKPWQFYYKHCSTNGSEGYYSKTSDDCNGSFG